MASGAPTHGDPAPNLDMAAKLGNATLDPDERGITSRTRGPDTHVISERVGFNYGARRYVQVAGFRFLGVSANVALFSHWRPVAAPNVRRMSPAL